MLYAVAITGLVLLIVLAVLIGLALRLRDEVASRRRPRDDRD
jgi:hypothetical protein